MKNTTRTNDDHPATPQPRLRPSSELSAPHQMSRNAPGAPRLYSSSRENPRAWHSRCSGRQPPHRAAAPSPTISSAAAATISTNDAGAGRCTWYETMCRLASAACRSGGSPGCSRRTVWPRGVLWSHSTAAPGPKAPPHTPQRPNRRPRTRSSPRDTRLSHSWARRLSARCFPIGGCRETQTQGKRASTKIGTAKYTWGGRVLTFKPVRYANARGRRNARCPNRASGMLVPPLPEPPGKYISSRGVKHFQRTNPPKNRNKKIALIRGANFSGALFVYVVCARFGTANSSSTVSEALPPRAHLLRLGWGWGPVIATQDGARTGPGAGLRLISGPNFRANLRPAVCSVLEPIWGQNAPNFQPIFGQVRSQNSDPFRVWPWPISGARFGPFPVPDLAHPQSRASPTSDAARSGLPRPEPRIATFFNEAPSFSEICSGNRDTWQDPL